jgi:phage shock protein PspC (stress-responsive transcriptional regulator)
MVTPTPSQASDRRDGGEDPRPEPFSFAKLRRNPNDKVVAGVCGGLGEALAVDPLWFRLAFVVLALGNGAGVGLYIVAWLMIPDQNPDAAHEGRSQLDAGRGRIIAGFVLVAVGLMLLVEVLVPWFDRVMWPLAVLALGAGLVYAGSRR